MPVVISQPTFFKAQYQKLRSRIGYKKAVVAVAHSLILAIYHILSGEDYINLGCDYYSKINPEQKAKRLLKQIQNLGISSDKIQELLIN